MNEEGVRASGTENARAEAGAHPPARGGADHDTTPDAAQGATWSRLLGLHPLVAFGMIAADMMLFGGEASTGGVALAITIPVALALALPCILLQRFSFKDPWGAAIGKGMLVGVLTAIPFPIGSPLTIIGGILGLRGLKPRPKLAPVAPIQTRFLPDVKK